MYFFSSQEFRLLCFINRVVGLQYYRFRREFGSQRIQFKSRRLSTLIFVPLPFWISLLFGFSKKFLSGTCQRQSTKNCTHCSGTGAAASSEVPGQLCTPGSMRRELAAPYILSQEPLNAPCLFLMGGFPGDAHEGKRPIKAFGETAH